MAPDYDVIIAGGGVIGASIAWRLARNNRRVLLLDAAKIGSEASSAAAGMLTPGGEFDQPSPLLDFAIGSLAKYQDFVAALEADSGLRVEFRQMARSRSPSPTPSLNRSPGALLFSERQAFHRRFLPATNSAPWSRWSGPTLLAPSTTPTKPLSIRRSHDRSSRRLPRARRDIEEESRVTSIAADATCAHVSIPDRVIQAPFAVMAAGAWSGAIDVTIHDQPYPLPRSFPMKGHLLGYRLPAGSLAATVRHDHTYVLQRADGFTIAGSSTEDAGFDRTIDAQIVSDIAARAGALVPALAVAPARIRVDRLPSRHRFRRSAYRTRDIE